MKKLSAIILVLAMVLALFSVSAFAEKGKMSSPTEMNQAPAAFLSASMENGVTMSCTIWMLPK